MVKAIYITVVVFAIFMLYEQKRHNDLIETMCVNYTTKNDSGHKAMLSIINSHTFWIMQTYPNLDTTQVDISNKQMGE